MCVTLYMAKNVMIIQLWKATKMKRTSEQKMMYYTNPNFYSKILAQMQDIEEKVAFLLAHDEQCRNDDWYLLGEYLRQVDGLKAILLPIRGEQRQFLTSFESIRRCRQKLQEMGLFCATNDDVMEKRRIKESAIMEFVKG